ncbi:uncharacterized protein LY79DRAFT_674303 [Colletotrichum navitas]|uniref:Uncharacterized protein n=1 Tax=Colletotrichum navitas TaxID=681940 RepID=A0AAD8PMI8_9PEZI|nr:uncharacterized protein LY79DRAFT_674303 [Colletotrichum navitas]KAK1570012.1 hypothetical protein LY79DRAFT_674303 [Colletotrichum navitas]
MSLLQRRLQKEAAIAALISENFVKAKSSKFCTLRFETHKVHLPCPVLVSVAHVAQHAPSDAIHKAYLDASKIQSAREKYLELPGTDDPYIFAVLIALAQHRQLSESAAATTSSLKRTHPMNHEEFMDEPLHGGLRACMNLCSYKRRHPLNI